MLVETLGTSKIYKNSIHVPKHVFERLGLKNGGRLVWGLNENGEIFVSAPKKKSLPYY